MVDEARMEQTADSAIAAIGVSVFRGGTPVVRDLTLSVPRGAVYGLVGPSGAGKSTVLRVLATVLRPDHGAVRVDGMDAYDDLRAARARIGYLPDAFGVYEALTVREYLDFYAALFGVPSRQRRRAVDDLLELFRLTGRRDTPVGTLSRGMRQQLGMARCLVHDPDILLLDEPAAGMDPQARLELRDILAELARLEKTILISSHLLPELAEISTYLGLMRQGQLVLDGETDVILDEMDAQLTGSGG
jgi:ABC-2 type transport system ATP-binding protein